MNTKSDIDKIRNSGGSADIGTKEDGAIKELLALKNRMIVIKEKSLYEYQMADDIDPQRTNPDLPNMVQKLILNQGSDSELVSRTFLTARLLFKKEYYDKSLDTDRLLNLALELLMELCVLQSEIETLIAEETKLIAEYEAIKNQKVSYATPSILNLETRCKTIFQKTDHIEQTMMEMITIFYPDSKLTKQSHFPKLYEFLESRYGKENNFSKFISSTLPSMKVIRGIRNGLDHRLDTVNVYNFELQTDGNTFSPSLSFSQKKEKLERIALSTYLPNLLSSLINIVEVMIAFLAGMNVKEHPLGYMVKDIPEEKRKNKNVKYTLWSPIGKEGIYYQ